MEVGVTTASPFTVITASQAAKVPSEDGASVCKQVLNYGDPISTSSQPASETKEASDRVYKEGTRGSRKRYLSLPTADIMSPKIQRTATGKIKKPTASDHIADLKRTIECMKTEMTVQIEKSINTAIERWREDWTELINKRVKEVMDLELQEVKTDVCMLEATVKLKADQNDLEKTDQRVDKLDRACQSLKGEVRSVKEGIQNIKDITDRLDPFMEVGAEHEANRKADRDLTEMRERIRALESSGDIQFSSEPGASVGLRQTSGIVIKNLPEEPSEKTDKSVLLNKVKTLFKVGLKLDVHIFSVDRKISRTSYPGLVTVKLEDQRQKTLVLRAKRALRNTEQYVNVYIEPELSYEVRQQQRNTKMLLKACGRDDEFQYKNGRLIKRVDERQLQFYDRVQKQQDEWLDRPSRDGPRYRQFVNRGFRGGRNREQLNSEEEPKSRNQWSERRTNTGGNRYATPVPSTSGVRRQQTQIPTTSANTGADITAQTVLAGTSADKSKGANNSHLPPERKNNAADNRAESVIELTDAEPDERLHGSTSHH